MISLIIEQSHCIVSSIGTQFSLLGWIFTIVFYITKNISFVAQNN